MTTDVDMPNIEPPIVGKAANLYITNSAKATNDMTNITLDLNHNMSNSLSSVLTSISTSTLTLGGTNTHTYMLCLLLHKQM